MIKEPTQLLIFPKGDVEQDKALRFVGDLERHLNNIKYIYTQITHGNISEKVKESALATLREAQINLCTLAARLGIEYKIHKDRSYSWYYDVFIKDRVYVMVQNPLPQQDLYEMIYYQLNRLRTTFYVYRNNWQPFCSDYVKGIEDNFILTYKSLK